MQQHVCNKLLRPLSVKPNYPNNMQYDVGSI